MLDTKTVKRATSIVRGKALIGGKAYGQWNRLGDRFSEQRTDLVIIFFVFDGNVRSSAKSD